MRRCSALAYSPQEARRPTIPNGRFRCWSDFPPAGRPILPHVRFNRFLERHLGGANIAVVNRPGASSALMQQELANADPDGYTIGLASMPALVSVLFGRDVEYAIDDFDYLGTLTSSPHSLVVNVDSPYQSLDDLVEQLRTEPQSITMGGAGLGSAAHLALMLFEAEADVSFNFVPGPGASEMRNQVMGGFIDGGLTAVGGGAQMHAEGQGRVLGVMAAERFPLAPDLPTFAEQGYNVEWGAVRGLVAPGRPARRCPRNAWLLRWKPRWPTRSSSK